MNVVLLVADGARPDTIAAAMDRGDLPALAALRAEGGAHTVTTAFPSVTGIAYAPFLLGRFPASVGLPGLRWFDRTRSSRPSLGHSRSYVGAEMRMVDRDLSPEAPTIFELVRESLGALSVIARGLPRSHRLGGGLQFIARAAAAHFRGDVGGWLAIDKTVSDLVVARVRERKPRFTFAAFTGVDKASHAHGHDSRAVLDALRVVDDTAARIRRDAERDGRWRDFHLWIASDHGHSPVHAHDDLADWVRSLGFRVRAHPWVLRKADVAVMVSGNAMAHLYVDLGATHRSYWPVLASRWQGLLEQLLARKSVDLVAHAVGAGVCAVHGRGRGRALIVNDGDRFSYRPETGDPLGIGAREGLSEAESFEATIGSDYPDAIVQLAALCSSPRAGDLIVSAARGWDFRERYEPIRHVSAHGALHREHMLVPLLMSRFPVSRPRRTVDIMPSALAALGTVVPTGLDGRSFV